MVLKIGAAEVRPYLDIANVQRERSLKHDIKIAQIANDLGERGEPW